VAIGIEYLGSRLVADRGKRRYRRRTASPPRESGVGGQKWEKTSVAN
jgi:hypothetical protein